MKKPAKKTAPKKTTAKKKPAPKRKPVARRKDASQTALANVERIIGGKLSDGM